MHEICEFLNHMEQPRVIEETPEDDNPDVRSDENKSQLRENTLMGVRIVYFIYNYKKEEIYGMYDRNARDKEKIKGILNNAKTQLINHLQTERDLMKQKFQMLFKQREEIKAKFQSKNEKERQLFDLCKLEKPNHEVKYLFYNL
jgi:hypothetical protein